MGLFDSIGKKDKKVPPNASFRITEQGKEKLQEGIRDPKSQILVALETHGSSNLNDISAASGLSRGQVERLLPKLVQGGYVQYAGASSGDD